MAQLFPGDAFLAESLLRLRRWAVRTTIVIASIRGYFFLAVKIRKSFLAMFEHLYNRKDCLLSGLRNAATNKFTRNASKTLVLSIIDAKGSL
jgi:hypothetical protein